MSRAGSRQHLALVAYGAAAEFLLSVERRCDEVIAGLEAVAVGARRLFPIQVRRFGGRRRFVHFRRRNGLRRRLAHQIVHNGVHLALGQFKDQVNNLTGIQSRQRLRHRRLRPRGRGLAPHDTQHGEDGPGEELGLRRADTLNENARVIDVDLYCALVGLRDR
jgi:hypothetical protein